MTSIALAILNRRLDLLVCAEDMECDSCDNSVECLGISSAIDVLEEVE